MIAVKADTTNQLSRAHKKRFYISKNWNEYGIKARKKAWVLIFPLNI